MDRKIRKEMNRVGAPAKVMYFYEDMLYGDKPSYMKVVRCEYSEKDNVYFVDLEYKINKLVYIYCVVCLLFSFVMLYQYKSSPNRIQYVSHNDIMFVKDGRLDIGVYNDEANRESVTVHLEEYGTGMYVTREYEIEPGETVSEIDLFNYKEAGVYRIKYKVKLSEYSYDVLLVDF